MSDLDHGVAGQSNMIDMITSGGATITGVLGRTVFVSVLQQLLDPLFTEVTVQNGKWRQILTSEPTTVSAMGSLATGSSALIDWYVTDGVAANWQSWTETSVGIFYRAYWESLTSTEKTNIKFMISGHNEYDSDTTRNGGTVEVSMIENVQRKRMGVVRTALGKTAAELPWIYFGPMPFAPGASQPSRNRGMDAVMKAYVRLAADASCNAYYVPTGMWAATEWDLDTPGSYGSHADAEDLRRMGAWMARQVVWHIGHQLAPTRMARRRYAAFGPKPYYAHAVNASTIDVYVQHHGGSALRVGLSAQTTAGLAHHLILDNGVTLTPVSVTIPASTSSVYRIAVGQDFRQRITTYQNTYGNPGPSGRDGGIFDNTASATSAVDFILPPTWVAAERLDLPVQRTLFPLKLKDSAP